MPYFKQIDEKMCHYVGNYGLNAVITEMQCYLMMLIWMEMLFITIF